jgi:hypothetical protein
MGPETKYGKHAVRVYDESGWFSVFARQLFNPNYALFMPFLWKDHNFSWIIEKGVF